MRFDFAPRRRPTEAIVPMINVVFLLLIFFLMTATLPPPEPFDIRPPQAAGATEPGSAPEPEPEPGVLYLGADGALAFGAARGEAALAAAALAAREMAGEGAALVLRADASLPGVELARLLQRLAALGVGRVDLVTASSSGNAPRSAPGGASAPEGPQ